MPNFSQDTNGYIYFALGHTTRLIKIGFTTQNPKSRLKSLQTSSPDKLELIGVMRAPFEAEEILHELFADSHSHGEWFSAAILESPAYEKLNITMEL